MRAGGFFRSIGLHTSFAQLWGVAPLPTNPHRRTTLFTRFLVPLGIVLSLAVFAESWRLIPIPANSNRRTAALATFVIPLCIFCSLASFA